MEMKPIAFRRIPCEDSIWIERTERAGDWRHTDNEELLLVFEYY
jgi:hypothetical protein